MKKILVIFTILIIIIAITIITIGILNSNIWKSQ